MHTHNNPSSDLTLESIYRKDPVFKVTGLTIKVLIQGEKAMTALFLTCETCFFFHRVVLTLRGVTADILPHGLLFMSKDQ
jgi:hypothetical protein